ADVSDAIEQKALAGLVHLGGRLLEAEVQKVPLTPASRRARRLLVFATAENFYVRIVVETIGIRAPAGPPLLCRVADNREHGNGRVSLRWTERLGSRAIDHRPGVDGKRLAEEVVLA